MSKNITTLKIISFLLFAVFFVGCSQNLPEINNASGSVIFEYADKESLPKARFSVFVESEENQRRGALLKVKSVEKGYEWETENLIMFDDEGRKMAGYNNFVMPEGEAIPQGKYTVVYMNADQEEVEAEFTMAYNQKYYELKSEEVPDFMRKNNGNNRIAIYDESEVLIFYGERTGEFRTTRDIWNKFQHAEYFNDLWYSTGKSVICVLPNELVKPEKVNKENIENN